MKSHKQLLIATTCMFACIWAQAYTTGPAPAGDPKEVAKRTIAEAEHPCPKVTRASRNKDGSLSGMCSNREDYRIFAVDKKPVVMRCSAARKMGIAGC